MARLRLLRVDGWWGRMRGLAWRKPPGPRVGILLTPCFAVHTFGMRHPIDVAFVSRSGRVLELRRALAPRAWRYAWAPLPLSSCAAASLMPNTEV